MTTDDRLIEEVTPEDIRLYLQANRWAEEAVNDFLSVWTHPGTELSLFAPRRTNVLDYDTQVNLLMRFLAEFEDRQRTQILSDMRFTGADVIRLRIDTSVLERGTIAFNKAAEVINQSQRMLMAAARAAIHPQNFFVGGSPAEVSDYLDTTRLGQTEPGSFVFTIISPVTYRPAVVELPPRPAEGAVQQLPAEGAAQQPQQPFARRVTSTLSRSLNAIRNASVRQDRPLTAVFEDIVDEGVSANLCEALSVIAEQSVDRAVELDFTWSAKAPRTQETPRTKVVVPPIITPVLQDMSRHLKEVAPQPGFEVIGKVERLSNQELGEGFDLALRANVEGRERLLALQLTDAEREVASTAWRTGRSVFTRGTLDKRYRPYRLLAPETFVLVEMPE